MILSVLIVVSLAPLGIICKKLLRRILPSRFRISNRNRIFLHQRLVVGGGALSAISLGYLWVGSSNYFPFLMGLTSLCLGSYFSVVGLTGGIASGKSTASTYLRDFLNIKVIDADRIARNIVAAGSPGLKKIVDVFGSSIIEPETGELNRKALGLIVFADPEKKRQLESITHPRILRDMILMIIWNRIRGFPVVVDVPLLFESKSPFLYLMCSECILIDVNVNDQKKRLLSRNPELSITDVDNRIASQLPRTEKLKLADYVINNDGTVNDLLRQLDDYFRYSNSTITSYSKKLASNKFTLMRTRTAERCCYRQRLIHQTFGN